MGSGCIVFQSTLVFVTASMAVRLSTGVRKGWIYPDQCFSAKPFWRSRAFYQSLRSTFQWVIDVNDSLLF